MRRFVRYIPAIIMFDVIWLLSSKPGLASDFSPMIDTILRKGAHMVEYAIFAICLVIALKDISWNKMNPRYFDTLQTKVYTGTLLVALSDEWHQSWVINRTAKPHDLIYDSLGFVICYMGCFILWQWSRRGVKS